MKYQKAFDFADRAVKLAPDKSVTYLRRAIANGKRIIVAIKNLNPTNIIEETSSRDNLTMVNVPPQIKVIKKSAPSPVYLLLKFRIEFLFINSITKRL